MSSSDEEECIGDQQLRVLISSKDKNLATRLAIEFLNGSDKYTKNNLKSDKSSDESDVDISLINKLPQNNKKKAKTALVNKSSVVKSSPLSNKGKSTKQYQDKDKFTRRSKLSENEITLLLNESSSEGSQDSEEDGDLSSDVWTVAGRRAGQSPQAPKSVGKSVRRSLNLGSSDSAPNSPSLSKAKKQKVSPLKLMRSKVNGTDRGSLLSTKTQTIGGEDSPRLRDRRSLKKPGWLESEDDSINSDDCVATAKTKTPWKGTSSPRTPRSLCKQELGHSPLIGGRSLRDRSELKKPSWFIESDGDDSDLNSPRTRASLRIQERSKSSQKSQTTVSKKLTHQNEEQNDSISIGGTPTKRRLGHHNSIIDSPRTPVSLRKLVLEANTPRRMLNKGGDDKPVIDLAATPPQSDKECSSPPITPRSSVRKKLSMTPGKRGTPSTPSSVKKVGYGFLTPVIAERSVSIAATPSSDIDLARTQLHVSSVPSSLPCREKEFNDICNFLTRKIHDKAGSCMYISGVPGTGKTATVHAVVRHLQKTALDRKLPSFDFVEVNGLRLTEPRQAYVRVVQSLTGDKMSIEQAHRALEKRFCATKPKRPTVLLIDELDYLCNRRQDVIYNFLEWTCLNTSRLAILTIANTMDLPERTLKGKVTSRMGLTRLVFHPYSYQQLQQIVMNRLAGSSAFHPDAVQLVARKVAAVSGDARRALDICRRATELVGSGELEGDDDGLTVTVLHVEKCLNQIFTGARVQAIRNISLMGQYLLRSIRDETLRTGLEETNLRQVYNHLQAVCALEGTTLPTVGDVLSLCWSLAECGLILAEKGRCDINKKLSLNVSSDDIHYALNL